MGSPLRLKVEKIVQNNFWIVSKDRKYMKMYKKSNKIIINSYISKMVVPILKCFLGISGSN